MNIHWPTVLSSAIGRIVGGVILALFLAVCSALGFGPPRWAAWVVSGTSLVTPEIARGMFGALAILTFLAIGFLLWTLLFRIGAPPLTDEAHLQKVLESQRIEDTKVISAQIVALDAQFNNAKRIVRERTIERDKVEASLNDSPSPATSEAYRLADEKLGAAWREHDVIRDDLLRVKGALPKEPAYMTAYEVIHYLADESEWGDRIKSVRVQNNINPNYPMHKQPLLEAPLEFRRVAEQGEVSAVGRENGKGAPVPIPETYWMVATLSPFSLSNPDVSETIPAVPDSAGVPLYKGVKIFRADVYEAWPRASRQEEQEPHADEA